MINCQDYHAVDAIAVLIMKKSFRYFNTPFILIIYKWKKSVFAIACTVCLINRVSIFINISIVTHNICALAAI